MKNKDNGKRSATSSDLDVFESVDVAVDHFRQATTFVIADQLQQRPARLDQLVEKRFVLGDGLL